MFQAATVLPPTSTTMVSTPSTTTVSPGVVTPAQVSRRRTGVHRSTAAGSMTTVMNGKMAATLSVSTTAAAIERPRTMSSNHRSRPVNNRSSARAVSRSVASVAGLLLISEPERPIDREAGRAQPLAGFRRLLEGHDHEPVEGLTGQRVVGAQLGGGVERRHLQVRGRRIIDEAD